MPIKGLTDRQTPTFPKIGNIRKGAKKTKADRPGADLTYFRYVALEGEEAAAETFHQIYGDEPREINIFLPFDDIERNFEAFMERHTASALQCRGDGETAFLWRDENGEMQRTPKNCPSPHCNGCKQIGRLKIIVPELRRLAYVTVHTTSVWDIVEITENLNALRQLTGNGLKGIPLVLKRRPRMVSTPREGGKRARQEMWLLSIEADPAWVEHQIEALTAATLLDMPAQPLALDELTGEFVGPDAEDDVVIIDKVTDEIVIHTDAAKWRIPTEETEAPDTDDWDDDPDEEETAPNNSRPYSPPIVRQGVRQHAGWIKGSAKDWSDARRQPDDEQEAPDEQEVKKVATMVGAAFSDNKDNSRHSVLSYIIGVESTKLLTDAEVKACLKWLEAGPGAWVPSGSAAEECRLILREAMREKGQQELGI